MGSTGLRRLLSTSYIRHSFVYYQAFFSCTWQRLGICPRGLSSATCVNQLFLLTKLLAVLYHKLVHGNIWGWLAFVFVCCSPFQGPDSSPGSVRSGDESLAEIDTVSVDTSVYPPYLGPALVGPETGSLKNIPNAIVWLQDDRPFWDEPPDSEENLRFQTEGERELVSLVGYNEWLIHHKTMSECRRKDVAQLLYEFPLASCLWAFMLELLGSGYLAFIWSTLHFALSFDGSNSKSPPLIEACQRFTRTFDCFLVVLQVMSGTFNKLVERLTHPDISGQYRWHSLYFFLLVSYLSRAARLFL